MLSIALLSFDSRPDAVSSSTIRILSILLHRGVRCVLFGDLNEQDNSILLWKRATDGPGDVEAKKINHSCWITCLLATEGGMSIESFRH